LVVHTAQEEEQREQVVHRSRYGRPGSSASTLKL
jgi:hypothetical protein